MKPVFEIRAVETEPGRYTIQVSIHVSGWNVYTGSLTMKEEFYRMFIGALSTGVLAKGGLELKIKEEKF